MILKTSKVNKIIAITRTVFLFCLKNSCIASGLINPVISNVKNKPIIGSEEAEECKSI